LQNPKFSHHKIKERGRNERLGGQIKWIYSSLTGFTKKLNTQQKNWCFLFCQKDNWIAQKMPLNLQIG